MLILNNSGTSDLLVIHYETQLAVNTREVSSGEVENYRSYIKTELT